MFTHIVSLTLLSAALLASCAPSHPDMRPDVFQPLNEARLLANGWGDKALVIAKLNQAASVPNLNSAEKNEIRATTIYALGRAGLGGPFSGFNNPVTSTPNYSQNLGYTGLR